MRKLWNKLVIFGSIIALVYFCTENDIEHYHLWKEGITTRAYIYEIGGYGKGPIPLYRFYIKGVEYKGFTNNAVHKHTAAELIMERADAEQEHMGLTTWENAPDGKLHQRMIKD